MLYSRRLPQLSEVTIGYLFFRGRIYLVTFIAIGYLTEWFMSDDAPQYYLTWVGTFKSIPKNCYVHGMWIGYGEKALNSLMTRSSKLRFTTI